jgi:hypothetical protein
MDSVEGADFGRKLDDSALSFVGQETAERVKIVSVFDTG